MQCPFKRWLWDVKVYNGWSRTGKMEINPVNSGGHLLLWIILINNELWEECFPFKRNYRQLHLPLARLLSINYQVFFYEIEANLRGENLVGWTNFCGFRDQNSHRFRDQGSNFWVKILDQLRKNIPRYDHVKYFISSERATKKSVHLRVLHILHILNILWFTDINSETKTHFFLVKFLDSTSEYVNKKRQVFEFLIQGALRELISHDSLSNLVQSQ